MSEATSTYPLVYTSYWGIPLTLVVSDFPEFKEAERQVAMQVALALVHASYEKGAWHPVTPVLLGNVKMHVQDLFRIAQDRFDEMMVALQSAGLVIITRDGDEVASVIPTPALAERAVAHLNQGEVVRMIAPIKHLLPKTDQVS